MIEQILNQPEGSIDNLTVNLDNIPFSQKYNLLSQILSKISKSGTINIVGMDIYSFGKWISGNQKNIPELNSVLENVKSLDTLENVKRFLLNQNFKTVVVKKDNGHYVCTARHQM